MNLALDMPSFGCLWNVQMEIIQEVGLFVRPSKSQALLFLEAPFHIIANILKFTHIPH